MSNTNSCSNRYREMLDTDESVSIKNYEEFFSRSIRVLSGNTIGRDYIDNDKIGLLSFHDENKNKSRHQNLMAGILRPLINKIKTFSWVADVRIVVNNSLEHTRLSRQRLELRVLPSCELGLGQLDALKYMLKRYMLDCAQLNSKICQAKDFPIFVASYFDESKREITKGGTIIIHKDRLLIDFVEKIMKANDSGFEFKFYIEGDRDYIVSFEKFDQSKKVRKTENMLTFNSNISATDFDNNKIKLDSSNEPAFEKRRVNARYRSNLEMKIKNIQFGDEVEIVAIPVYKIISFNWGGEQSLELLDINIIESQQQNLSFDD